MTSLILFFFFVRSKVYKIFSSLSSENLFLKRRTWRRKRKKKRRPDFDVAVIWLENSNGQTYSLINRNYNVFRFRMIGASIVRQTFHFELDDQLCLPYR